MTYDGGGNVCMCISETSSTHNTPCSPSAGTPVGTHPMVDYVTEDGRYNGTSYTGVVSVFDDAVQEPASPMEWTCQEDSAYEEPEVSLPVGQFAVLLTKANAYDALMAVCVHAPGCVCE